jgi:hypothetical protein
MDVSNIFSDYFLDFGNYIVDFDKIHLEIEKACQLFNSVPVREIFKKQEPQPAPSLQMYQEVLATYSTETLPQMILGSDLLKDYPNLEKLMAEEEPCFSTLHYISGSSLFYFVGTTKGKLWGIPMSIKSDEDMVIVEERSREGSSVSYIRIFGGNLFVSWDDGWLGVYAIQNLISFLEMSKINRAMEKQLHQKTEVITVGLEKLLIYE